MRLIVGYSPRRRHCYLTESTDPEWTESMPRRAINSLEAIRTSFPRPSKLLITPAAVTCWHAAGRLRVHAEGVSPRRCDYDFGITVELAAGKREFTLQPRESDCSVVLDDLRDEECRKGTCEAKASPTRPNPIARFFGALFPTLSAQSYTLRQVYHHIYTCGIACAGRCRRSYRTTGMVELPLQRRQRSDGQRTGGWSCGRFNVRSAERRCLKLPTAVAGAPALPDVPRMNTGWWTRTLFGRRAAIGDQGRP